MILLQVVYRVRLHRQSPIAAITHYVPLIFNTKRPNTMRRWRGTTGALTKKKKENGRKRGEIEQKRQSVSEREKKKKKKMREEENTSSPGFRRLLVSCFKRGKKKENKTRAARLQEDLLVSCFSSPSPRWTIHARAPCSWDPCSHTRPVAPKIPARLETKHRGGNPKRHASLAVLVRPD